MCRAKITRDFEPLNQTVLALESYNEVKTGQQPEERAFLVQRHNHQARNSEESSF
jgi:hypothetical protein